MMLKDYLFLISLVLILIVCLKILLTNIKYKKIKLEETTGFDFAKELTSNYDEINIVESKEITLSKYNLKRNLIRLTPNNYNSTSISTLAKVSLLSGYSLLNINRDKYLSLLRKFFPNLDYLNKSSLIALIISIFTNTMGDAKIAGIFLVLILIYQYLINTININSKEIIKDQIQNKENYSLITKVQNNYLLLNKISFIVTLILLLRIIVIIIY